MILLLLLAVLSSVESRSLEIEQSEIKKSGLDPFDFEDFISGRFNARSFNGSWWSKNQLYWSDQEGNLVAWNFEDDTTSVIVSADLLASVHSDSEFKGFSPDSTMLLFAYDVDSVWRHSFTATYLVLDSATKQNVTIKSPSGGKQLQYCAWIKNSENKNSLIYVFENNLYWRQDALDENNDIAVTTDGVVDNVFNGIPDWVYEEEVLGVNYANHMSPSGYKMAFAQFNDTLVPEFRYPHYGDPSDVFNNLYPTYKVVRYPKSGETNPTVKLFVRQFSEEDNKPVIPPQQVTDWGEHIYAKIYWVDDYLLSVTWMNRIQNTTILSTCEEEATTWSCHVTYKFEMKNGWMDPATPVLYGKDGSVITIWSKVENDNLNYPHIVKIDANSNLVYLTEGQMVVTDILAWDKETGTIYFMGTRENAPGARHFYSVDDTGNHFITCLTCSNFNEESGEWCEYNGVTLSQDNQYYIHKCSGETVPEETLRRTSSGEAVSVLEDNSALKDRLTSKSLPTRTAMTMPVGDKGFQAPVVVMTPPDLDTSRKYPMLLYIYGGPGSQQVSSRWKLGWETYLTSSKNIIYAVMDGRGTGFQSDQYKFEVYRNLGTVEMDDQIAVTRSLVEMFDYVDPARVGIWGWSYGGFNTAMTLERDVGPDPVFSCGISVAPVTSWMLYDSIYTERFMALPEDNQAGYNNSVIAGIENLRGKTWMLNHGVADDNVHYQHSMLLTRALELADVQFEQHSYADENHSLRGVSRFLYHAMDNFWSRCFQL